MSNKLLFQIGLFLNILYLLSFLGFGLNGHYSSGNSLFSLGGSVVFYSISMLIHSFIFLLNSIGWETVQDILKGPEAIEEKLIVLDKQEDPKKDNQSDLWRFLAVSHFCISLFLFIGWFDFRLHTISNLCFVYTLAFSILGWLLIFAPKK
ncbi:MAG: hypothetical protein GY810_04090 [Aureispira sp.]|nr:hypothetical protein [Aureispira sp.]